MGAITSRNVLEGTGDANRNERRNTAIEEFTAIINSDCKNTKKTIQVPERLRDTLADLLERLDCPDIANRIRWISQDVPLNVRSLFAQSLQDELNKQGIRIRAFMIKNDQHFHLDATDDLEEVKYRMDFIDFLNAAQVADCCVTISSFQRDACVALLNQYERHEAAKLLQNGKEEVRFARISIRKRGVEGFRIADALAEGISPHRERDSIIDESNNLHELLEQCLHMPLRIDPPLKEQGRMFVEESPDTSDNEALKAGEKCSDIAECTPVTTCTMRTFELPGIELEAWYFNNGYDEHLRDEDLTDFDKAFDAEEAKNDAL